MEERGETCRVELQAGERNSKVTYSDLKKAGVKKGRGGERTSDEKN